MDYYTVLNVLPFQSNPGQQLCRSHRSSDAENHKVEASISQQSPVYGNRTFRVLHFNLISDYVCIVFLYFSTFVYILLYLKWEIMSTILLIFINLLTLYTLQILPVCFYHLSIPVKRVLWIPVQGCTGIILFPLHINKSVALLISVQPA